MEGPKHSSGDEARCSDFFLDRGSWGFRGGWRFQTFSKLLGLLGPNILKALILLPATTSV